MEVSKERRNTIELDWNEELTEQNYKPIKLGRHILPPLYKNLFFNRFVKLIIIDTIIIKL